LGSTGMYWRPVVRHGRCLTVRECKDYAPSGDRILGTVGDRKYEGWRARTRIAQALARAPGS